jgi:flagellar hook-associated protein 2
MTSAYNAESSSDYEPLTDDEKDSMSDTEIEKWEEKGKSGILRRDDTLSSLMSVMTTAMAKSYTIDGKTYALSTFGIKTLGITAYTTNTQNAYHIDGDEDDDNTSSNSDKLLAAINSDPDGVAQFFQKLTSSLYDSLTSKMSSTSLRSYGSFYNDKEMATEYSTYTKTISNWETKVSDLEDKYYSKFAAMESALATLQSSSSALSGLLG